jgi:hypothetical protein
MTGEKLEQDRKPTINSRFAKAVGHVSITVKCRIQALCF